MNLWEVWKGYIDESGSQVSVLAESYSDFAHAQEYRKWAQSFSGKSAQYTIKQSDFVCGFCGVKGWDIGPLVNGRCSDCLVRLDIYKEEVK
jgi:hypothetical protein